MKSPYYFIITPDKNKRYDNTINIEGMDFIASTSQEDFKFSNRVGIVQEVPLRYDGQIKKGDKVLVHHNVFKYYYDMKGKQKSGRSFLKDNTFFVDESQFFAYKQNGSWNAYSKYCFVKPLKKKDYFIEKPGTTEPLVGEMKYINSELKKLGVAPGDIVAYEPHSEYEFKVDGEKLYRMYTNNITMIL